MIEHIITSTVLILFILIISAVLETKINPCIKYALWLLVAVKLLIPLSTFENNINIMNLVRQMENANVQYIFVDNATEKNTDTTDDISNMNAGEEVTLDNAISSGTVDSVNLSTIFKYIWICGMVLCAGVFLWSNIRFRIRLNQKRQLAGKYKNRLPIYAIDGIGMPCLFGVFRPAIYLEKDYGLSEQQCGYILEHEYTHFRHGDHIWAVVRCLCVILYWYNPLVWLAAHKSIADSELACDAGTLKQLVETEHISYGRTLIEMAENLSKKKYSMRILECSTSVVGGMREMKKRIKMIAKRPHTKMVTLAVTLILCCGIVSCTFGRSADEAHINLSDAVTDTTENSMQEDSADNVGNAALDALIDGYSNADIESAKQVVMDHFKYVLAGCTIKELYYDESSTKLTNAEWAEQYNDREAIVFTSSFAVDETGGNGSFTPNSIYTGWQWILSRSHNGEWRLQAGGYGGYGDTENEQMENAWEMQKEKEINAEIDKQEEVTRKKTEAEAQRSVEATKRRDNHGYSDEEIESAKQIVTDFFQKEFTGCTLKELYYDPSKSGSNWLIQYNEEEVIILVSSFDVDETGVDGSLNADSTYTDWQWILTRSNKGAWTLRTWGY